MPHFIILLSFILPFRICFVNHHRVRRLSTHLDGLATKRIKKAHGLRSDKRKGFDLKTEEYERVKKAMSEDLDSEAMDVAVMSEPFDLDNLPILKFDDNTEEEVEIMKNATAYLVKGLRNQPFWQTVSKTVNKEYRAADIREKMKNEFSIIRDNIVYNLEKYTKNDVNRDIYINKKTADLWEEIWKIRSNKELKNKEELLRELVKYRLLYSQQQDCAFRDYYISVNHASKDDFIALGSVWDDLMRMLAFGEVQNVLDLFQNKTVFERFHNIMQLTATETDDSYTNEYEEETEIFFAVLDVTKKDCPNNLCWKKYNSKIIQDNIKKNEKKNKKDILLNNEKDDIFINNDVWLSGPVLGHPGFWLSREGSLNLVFNEKNEKNKKNEELIEMDKNLTIAQVDETWSLSKLGPNKQRKRKRLGRGVGSGIGGSCGRGQNGQLSRGRGHFYKGFEGGQMPLYRTIKKPPGYRPGPGFWYKKYDYDLIKLDHLNKLPPGASVDFFTLRKMGISGLGKKSSTIYNPVKVVGWSLNEEERNFFAKNITVQAHAFTRSAARAIVSSGGRCELLQPQRYDRVIGTFDPAEWEGHKSPWTRKRPKPGIYPGPYVLPSQIRNLTKIEEKLAKHENRLPRVYP
eukprot:GHVL01022032.1.p1 GENE.GHVL01022032.1~~GHVL01022032.1.p1  ORF type:complete len:630 (+),score=151.77 GHVL01022032.1:46-1935(+)